MKKFNFSDVLIGLVLTLLALAAYFLPIGFFETLELKTYDWRSFLRQSAQPGTEIALVAIDDDSINKIGRWPWPRSLVADGIAAVKTAGAKVIALNILFTEEERNQGLAEIRNLKGSLDTLLSAYPATNARLRKSREAVRERLTAELSAAELRLDSDTKLKDAVGAAGNVILPMYFAVGPSLGEEPPVLTSHTLTQVENGENAVLFPVTEGHSPAAPLEAFAQLSPGIGHVNLPPDADGVVRAELPIIQFQGDFYPSFAVQIARAYLNLPLEEVRLALGASLTIGKLVVPLDASNRMLISYTGPVGTFPYYSFYDVVNGKVEPAAFRGKIVLIGHLATGIADLNVTPLGPGFPGIEITANILQNMLHRNFVTRPAWAMKAEAGAIVFVGLFVALLLPRLKALVGTLLSLVLMGAIAGAGTYYFVAEGYWLKIFDALFLLVSGYLIVTSKRFFVTEKRKELVEAGAIETNKMLGLSFQGQGMLDLAFEKFRKCPIDEPMKELLYNLALDFERKRQFNKAVAVYEHIMTADAGYKGIKDRITQLKAAADGAVFGVGVKKGAAEGTVILEGAASATPTLGRYEIVKELGRGAMGTVYLGRDPKINRPVAIKTLRFDDDVDEATMKTVKERFFREAESAGKLNHPNIIRVFDAGEDHEVSYIAMELLDGEDLKKFTAQGSLLPLPTVVEYISRIADALDYAHAQGVVHRDIKPANIMLLKDGTLRITDFGIARITASSKTQTGTVLGTPSYMSPEQLAGRKVDGRSDLFSLGTMFYELLLGEKPFEGESIATLLFKISNERHPDLKAKNPALAGSIVAVIDRLLAKDPEARYARGADVVKDLSDFLRNNVAH